ncbi:hypothetical protein V3H18_08830 [Methylocystis sp. 9N]|uniref:Uncharacterized protein n=1 Tax=Methylocystis borbori TaxID=3118750 RepID=A0ABU7XHG8_9HYPH
MFPGDESGTVRQDLWPHPPTTRAAQILRWFEIDSGAIPLIALEQSKIVAIVVKSATSIANEIRTLATHGERGRRPAGAGAVDRRREGDDEPFFMFFRTTGCVKLPPRIAFLITENSLLLGGDVTMIAPGARGADNIFLCPEMAPSFAERYAAETFPLIPDAILEDAIEHAPRLHSVASTGALVNNSRRAIING